MKKHKTQHLKEYLPPSMESYFFELENGLATSSSEVKIGDDPGDVKVDDWEEAPDIDGSLDW